MNESMLGKCCCDPYKIHKGSRQFRNLRTVKSLYFERAKNLNISLVLGEDRLCRYCIKKIDNGDIYTAETSEPVTEPPRRKLRKLEGSASDVFISAILGPDADDQDMQNVASASTSTSAVASTHMDVEYVDDKFNVSEFVGKLNEIFNDTDVPKIDYTKLRQKKYAAEMLKKITNFLSEKVFNMVENPIDGSDMIKQLKDKFEITTSRDERIKILSVLPEAWNANKIKNIFEVSYYTANLVKTLVKENGILCGIKKKLGSNRIDDQTVSIVQDFYREESRICPGLREFKKVEENGETRPVQRRLVLMNLKELYSEFKKKNENIKIGFSKFAELRPKECVLAFENYGTHTTCVCQYHQNYKLRIESLKKINILHNLKRPKIYWPT